MDLPPSRSIVDEPAPPTSAFAAPETPAALADEARRKLEKPCIDADTAEALASWLYGLNATSPLKELDSYDDRNFMLRAPLPAAMVDAGPDAAVGPALKPWGATQFPPSSAERPFLFKVHNGVESLNLPFVEAQNGAMACVRAAGLWCPSALPSAKGNLVETAELALADGKTIRAHAVRCLPFLPARLQGDVPPTPALLRKVGAYVGRVDVALSGFDHPAVRRTHLWDLRQLPALRPLLGSLALDAQRAAVDGVLAEFDAVVAPRASKLRMATIHGDANDQNVLVDEAGEEVVGILDFGDLVRSWQVCELAVTAAYILITLDYDETPAELAPFDAARAVAAGYNGELPLTDDEWAVLPTLIAARLALSLTVGSYSAAQDPANEYLRLTLAPGWRALQRWRATPHAEWALGLRPYID